MEPDVVAIAATAPDTLATLQCGVAYCAVDNGFARAHLLMDLIRPGPATPRPLPAIVFVAGNGWRSVDRAALVPQLAPFAKAGYLVATIDYRIVGEATFPEPLKDVKAAIRFLRAHAARYQLDPERIGIWGNSAGAHLSSLAATTGGEVAFENDAWPGHSSAVQCAALWYPPTDLSDLDGDVLTPPHLHLGVNAKDPVHADLVRRASPMAWIGPATPPILLVHGSEDPLVPIRHSERLHAALREAGRPSTFIRVEGAAHSFGQVSSQPEVMAQMLAFFDLHLKRQH